MKKHLIFGLAISLGLWTGIAGADEVNRVQAGGTVQFNIRVPLPPSYSNEGQNLQALAGTEDPDSPSDDNGQALQYDDADTPPPVDVMASLTTTGFYRQFNRYHHMERDTDQYYWHNYHGRRICHYVDGQGGHWIGLTVGTDDPQWTMLLWRDGRFWWHDTANNRWAFFYRNNWWSPGGPGSYPYQVYLQGQYYSCDRYGRIQTANRLEDEDHHWDRRDHDRQEAASWQSGGPVGNLQPTPDPNESTYYDQAKSRMIKVSGADRNAYLYDATADHTLDHVLLCGNVTDVQFLTDAEGKAWRIILTQQDGTQMTYDQDGHFMLKGHV